MQVSHRVSLLGALVIGCGEVYKEGLVSEGKPEDWISGCRPRSPDVRCGAVLDGLAAHCRRARLRNAEALAEMLRQFLPATRDLPRPWTSSHTPAGSTWTARVLTGNAWFRQPRRR